MKFTIPLHINSEGEASTFTLGAVTIDGVSPTPPATPSPTPSPPPLPAPPTPPATTPTPSPTPAPQPAPTPTPPPTPTPSKINRLKFFTEIRKHLGHLTQRQVDGTNVIIDGWESQNHFTDVRHFAYMLATTYHETAHTMQPIPEIAFGKGHAYGVPTGPWAHVYYGRGDVQLTWEDNYKHASVELAKYGINVDLDKNPEDALKPNIAFAILLYGMEEGWFTKKYLGQYFNSHVEEPTNAREIINGHDQDVLIANYYHAAMRALS